MSRSMPPFREVGTALEWFQTRTVKLATCCRTNETLTVENHGERRLRVTASQHNTENHRSSVI